MAPEPTVPTAAKGRRQEPVEKGPPRRWWTPANAWSHVAFTWANGPIDRANERRILEEDDAMAVMPDCDTAEELGGTFETTRNALKAKHGQIPSASLLNLTARALIRINALDLVLHAIFTCVEVGLRLSSPIALRYFLRWLARNSAGEGPPQFEGWLLALALGGCGFGMAILHHRLFWIGMHSGFTMRQQCVAAIDSKVLRLNAAAVSHVSPGHIINLVSNDVRRFDDAMPFWVFVWAGPLELCFVLLLVSLELGFLPALAGVSATLALMPLQAALVRPVAAIRRATAKLTDERVRLAGEVIQGSLAMKMLSWELPLARLLRGIRQQEASHIRRMANIRALNMAVQFAVTPAVSFLTFAVYRARGGHLQVSSVFYALSLLSLPRLYMVQFFVFGVQYMTELRVSLTRVDTLLSSEEPPTRGSKQGDGQGSAPAPAAATDHPLGTVALRGADYDWQRPLGHITSLLPPGGAINAGPPAGSDEATPGEAGTPAGVTLHGLEFQLAPGELMGVCGDVGAGKSSLLAALLGELLPLPERGSEAGLAPGEAPPLQHVVVHEPGTALKAPPGNDQGPVVAGRVAYCSQVPWIVACSVRDNIVFGQPFDAARYAAVLEACALNADLVSLPAGDATELGERGINLSGGQKARVALARAAYASPDVALLDDPLSAVDPRVARTLFTRCIGRQGVMAGRTRLLITHQRQFLPMCDRVMVLRGGRIIALGTWAEVSALDLPELNAGSHAGMEASVDELTDAAEADPGQETVTTDVKVPTTAAANTLVAEAQSTGGLGGDGTDDRDSGETGQGEDEAAASRSPASSPAVPSFATLRPTASRMRLALSRVFARESDSQQPNASQAGERQPGSSPEDPETGTDRGHQDPGAGATVDGVITIPVPKAGVPGADSADAKLTPRREPSLGRGRGVEALNPNGWMRAISRLPSLSRSLLPGNSARANAAKLAQAGQGAVAGQLVLQEERVMGSVTWRVYIQYMQAIGAVISALITLALFAGQAVYLASEWWLSLWAKSDFPHQEETKWLWVYGLLVGLVIMLSITRTGAFFYYTLAASTRIHDTMLLRVLRAPLSFFHTNPAGRILNRFSKDLGQVDDLLPVTFFDALQCGFQVLSAVVLVCIAVPVILPVFVPLGVAFVWLRIRYLNASREVKRWDAITRSPLFASFSSALKGLPTIRAYDAQPRFHAQFLSQLTINGSWSHLFLAVSRWVGFRLDVLSAFTQLAAALLAMATRATIQPSLLALALSHVMQLSGVMQWFVRQTAEVENLMTSLERMLEYTHLEQEPPLLQEGGPAPPPGWPTSGSLRYEGVTATYRAGLPPVLTDITFSLKGGTSCGVVGRTGSGKSSLMLTLFRLIPVTGGRILLDGLDIASIGLDALRKQLAIIPQDPVLFSGTIRSNLDPWSKHKDEELWSVLNAAKLQGAIEAAGGLDTRMGEAGDNLSVGQRQLFCLARALLQRAQVLALDEATANVDRGTDALIQGTLREFHSGEGGAARLQLIIAHRVDTIMDTDCLLVLNAGRLVEQGPPAELGSRPGGLFAAMLAASRASGGMELPPLPPAAAESR